MEVTMRSEEDIFPASWARSEECGGKQMHLGKLCLRGETSLSQRKRRRACSWKRLRA